LPRSGSPPIPPPIIFRLDEAAGLPGRCAANHGAFLEILGGDLAREIDYKMLNGTPVRSRVEDMLLHVVTHGCHHRGQLASKASSLGLKYPGLSYIEYSRRPR
jgi:hypothetical protein